MQLEPVAPVMHKGLPADVTRVTYTNQQIAWEEQQQTGVMDKATNETDYDSPYVLCLAST